MAMLLLLTACLGTGTVSVDPSNTSADDTGVTADDTGEAPAGWNPNGDYDGSFSVDIYWSAWNWGDDCDGRELNLSVEDRKVDGYGACYFDWDDEGGMLFEVYVEGELDDDNQLDGDVRVLLNEGVRTDDSDASAAFNAEDVTVEGDGAMTAYDETMDYSWEMDLQLD